MNDLEQIQKANARATLPEISRLRGEGYHVVVEYQGVNAVDVHGFKTYDEAITKQAEIDSQYGAKSVYYAPTAGAVADPLEHAEQQDTALAQQAQSAGVSNFKFVDTPAEPGNLTVRPVQVAAMVLVTGGDVAAIPPHRSMAVFDGDSILALCGPDTDLTSARDANVFANAFKLRAALATAIQRINETGRGYTDDLQAVLDAATPMFAKFDLPSAEQQLAAARENYDPTQNPDTSSILDDDRRPSETN